MSIQTIVEAARTKIAAYGGGEQSIGNMFDLAATCGVENEDDTFVWLANLGDALAEEGLQLVSGPGKPQDLYARPAPE